MLLMTHDNLSSPAHLSPAFCCNRHASPPDEGSEEGKLDSPTEARHLRGVDQGCSCARPKTFIFVARSGNMFRLAISAILALAVLGTVASVVAYAEEVKCEGTISKIEGEKVTVKTATEEHHLTVLPSTKIMVDGKPAKSSDLKVGQKVKCAAEKQGDKVTCTSIETMRS
jgi:hypothetical protein